MARSMKIKVKALAHKAKKNIGFVAHVGAGASTLPSVAGTFAPTVPAPIAGTIALGVNAYENKSKLTHYVDQNKGTVRLPGPPPVKTK